MAKASVSSSFKMASLPPTSAAAQQHSLPPSELGWKRDEHTLVAVATDEPAAPQTLLKLVSCACKPGCGNTYGCSTGGIVCSDICTHCMGETCSNTATRTMADDD